MTKDELLKEWVKKYFKENTTEKQDEIIHFIEVLAAVYDVGFEAGRDHEKLVAQLSKHGEPQGY